MTEWRSFTLPDPISTNALTRNVSTAERYFFEQRFGHKKRGRTWTNEYKSWRDEAILAVRSQLRPMPHCAGKFMLDVTLGGKIDLDNLKCIPDLCKSVGLIADDDPEHMEYLIVRYNKGHPCTVAIRPVGEWA